MENNDKKILNIIEKILNVDGNEEEISNWLTNDLKDFMPGISDLIYYSKEKLTPEEILKKAREMNKPIVL